MRGFFCALFAGIICLESLCGSQFREDRITDNEPTYAIRYETGKSDLTQELKLYAQGAVLLDADSGRVLYGKNETIPMAMASTTKIMTCILVLENAKVDETVSVSAYAATMPKVKLYVKCGEHYTVRELLFSLMLESHNDTAVVLGEYIGGKLLGETGEISEHTGEESKAALHRFAQAMNEKAEEIGCEDTWFITPNGLDATETLTLSDGSTLEREHHTTAKDLAEILRYCMKTSPQRDLFLEITGTQDYSFTENGRFFQCHNHNAFLQMMDGAFTGKTGFTNKAGYCYVGALKRDGKCLIVALLACGWPNHKTATEYNINVSFDGPAAEEDYETQNEMVRRAMDDGVDVIIFSAVDYNANAEIIDQAAQRGIKIIVIDSDVNSSQVSCRIGTNNLQAGIKAAEAALATDDEELYIGIVNYDVNSANGQQRELGFRQTVEQDPRVKI